MDRWARSVECSSAHYTIGRLASGLWHLISLAREKLFTVNVRGIWRVVVRAVSCRPFMAEAPVRSHATPCEGFSQKNWQLGRILAYRDSLRAGRSGVQTLLRARGFFLLQSGPGDDPASYVIGNGVLTRG